jgi:hypothetical protein
MLAAFQRRPWRSRRYLDWVKLQPCVAHPNRHGEPHHGIAMGLGGSTGSKASDALAMPVCRECHEAIHRDVRAWEADHGPQALHILRTIDLATREEILKCQVIA